MYIVYDGNNNINQLRSKYLVLELDSLEFMDGNIVKTYVVVDNQHITLNEMPILENLVDLHENLIKNYHQKNWRFCKQAIDYLKGHFSGEIDTFYDDLLSRIKDLEKISLPDDWSGNIKLVSDNLEENK